MSTTTNALPEYAVETLAALTVSDLLDLMVREEDLVPRNVIDRCAQYGDEMAAALAAVADDERLWTDDIDRGEWWLLLHAVNILGLIPTEAAGLCLVRFMRRMSAADDRELQDYCASCWPALFRNKPASVFPAVSALVDDRSYNWYIRINALDVVVAHSQTQGAQALEAALARVAAIACDTSETQDMRALALSILVDFPRPQYRALLERHLEEQDPKARDFSAFEVSEAFESMQDTPEWANFDDPWEFYSADAIAARIADEPDYAEWGGDDFWLPDDSPVDAPYTRLQPKIGRNDPCPCGSGKKYKKCCLPLAGD